MVYCVDKKRDKDDSDPIIPIDHRNAPGATESHMPRFIIGVDGNQFGCHVSQQLTAITDIK